MKLQGRAGAEFCKAPDQTFVGALIYGPDPGFVQIRRSELCRALTDGDDLRLDRIDAADARRDPIIVDTALHSRGFFPGRRAVLINGATDGLAAKLSEVLADLTLEDAFLIATADSLAARSSLRKLFESDRRLAAIAVYPDAPNAAEIDELLQSKGLGDKLEPEAMVRLVDFGTVLDRGQLVQLIEKISLFSYNIDTKLNAVDIERQGPLTAEAEIDRLTDAVAGGQVAAIGPLVMRMSASGISAVQMLLFPARRFRQLLALTTNEGGAERALKRLRPPVFGPKARVLTSQARRWSQVRIETALALFYQADQTLRSPGAKPDLAMVERTLIRVAMLAG